MKKWSDLSKDEKIQFVDSVFERIKKKIVNHATGVSITTDREQPEIRNGLGQIVVVRPETTGESITIDIGYI